MHLNMYYSKIKGFSSQLHYWRKLNESHKVFDIELMIKDVLADATDEGIKLAVREDRGGSPIVLRSSHPSLMEVTLYKVRSESLGLFTVKDIKQSVDSLISMLGDEYKLIKVYMIDDSGGLHEYTIKSFTDPWEYLQLVIKDNSFQRTYPDRDFPLNAVKFVFKNLKSDF